MSRIIIDGKHGAPVSPILYGVSFEDKSFSCDGGINANLIPNHSFDGFDPLQHWNFTGGSIRFSSEKRGESSYAIIYSEGDGFLSNLGYNGNSKYIDIPAIGIREEHTYIFSCDIRRMDYQGQIYVNVVNKADRALVKERSLQLPDDTEWHHMDIILMSKETNCGKLLLHFKGRGTVCLDQVSLIDADYWGAGNPKWSGGKLRRDLVSAIEQLRPSFIRFPGGRSGTYEYKWKNTVGPIINRKANGQYSVQVGFYEFFCMCEDLEAKPIPMLWTDDIDDYLDLIEFAKGDPAKNKWAAIRSEMGHPAPFENFDRMRVPNNAIADRIHAKYPDFWAIPSDGYFPPNGNASDTLAAALIEAAKLTRVEQLGDEKRRVSYVSLISMAEYGYERHSLITFNPLSVSRSANYYVQQLFSSSMGEWLLGFETSELPGGHFLSVTGDEGAIYIKYVNTTGHDEHVEVVCPSKVAASWAEILTAVGDESDIDSPGGITTARNEIAFDRMVLEQVRVREMDHELEGNIIRFVSKAYSVATIHAEEM